MLQPCNPLPHRASTAVHVPLNSGAPARAPNAVSASIISNGDSEQQAQRRHSQRMRQARNRELDHLREIMLSRAGRMRRNTQATLPSSDRVFMSTSSETGHAHSPMNKPQMVRMINELEAVALTEAMHKPGRRQGTTSRNGAAALGSPALAGLLDDAALMLAANHWSLAAELLHRVSKLGTAERVKDWTLRSAIDLLARDEQHVRAIHLSKRYIQQFGRAPGSLIPAPAHQGEPPGLLCPGPVIYWQCPGRLDLSAVTALQMKLHAGRIGGWPVVMDWSQLIAVDETARQLMQQAVEDALHNVTQPSAVHLHAGSRQLMRAAQSDLMAHRLQLPAWQFWLALLHWNGLDRAYRIAMQACARECPDAPMRPPTTPGPGNIGAGCIRQPFECLSHRGAEAHVTAFRLHGDLSSVHVAQLNALQLPDPQTGRWVLLDCSGLASMDLAFGAALLQWAQRLSADGYRILLASAHPLLRHFFRMLGLHVHARLCNAG